MRGFPLLSVFLVVAFFILAWWPLKQTIGDTAKLAEEIDAPLSSEERFLLEVTSSHPLASFSVVHLSTPLLTLDASGGAMEGVEFEQELEGIEVPPEGIELWVEATFSGSRSDDQRPVIRLELVSDDVERELGAVTLWGELGGWGIDAPAVFLWTATSNGS